MVESWLVRTSNVHRRAACACGPTGYFQQATGWVKMEKLEQISIKIGAKKAKENELHADSRACMRRQCLIRDHSLLQYNLLKMYTVEVIFPLEMKSQGLLSLKH